MVVGWRGLKENTKRSKTTPQPFIETASKEAAPSYSLVSSFFLFFYFILCYGEGQPGQCKYLEPTNGVSGYLWVANTSSSTMSRSRNTAREKHT